MQFSDAQLWDLDRHHLWHPYTRHSAALCDAQAFPIISRGAGVHLYDTSGRAYFDAISSWWACNLGHSHPRLVEAIRTQAGELQHSIIGNLTHPGAIRLAAELAGLIPGSRRHVLFAGDGASAVEAALRIAVQHWHNLGQPRTRLAALRLGYHGDTFGAMSLGYLPEFHAPYRDLLLSVLQFEAPLCAACPHNRRPAGNCGLHCFAATRRLFAEHGHSLAALIVEPLCQGAAGMRIYRPEFLQALAGLCREHGVLLIADEIAVGFGRSGRMFAFEHAGIEPDLVCLGKALSGGYLPMSAVLVKDEIFAGFSDRPADNTFYHGHTFAGNPLAAAAALACLQVYAEENIVVRAAASGEYLASLFAGLAELPGVQNSRCLGMIAAFELADGPDPARGGAARAQRLRQEMLDAGVLIRPLGNVVYLMPPLITPPGLLEQTVETMAAALKRG